MTPRLEDDLTSAMEVDQVMISSMVSDVPVIESHVFLMAVYSIVDHHQVRISTIDAQA